MDEKQFDYINVIPFIDIMLVLLTIVLTSSTFIAQGTMRIDLPRASGGGVEARREVTIEIDRTGALCMNARACTLGQIRKEMAPLDRRIPVFIRADHRIDLQRFVAVMDAVKGLGFRSIRLLTKMPA